ncbi:MAG: hypothetical protein OEW71_03165 [Candidatus Bathyarchaeota archaeon]|nr:hypothetical protein [Candidatus Bathyarchaeota archaeon]
MNWNKIGKNVKETTNDLSSKIFGIMKPSKSPYLKIPRKAGIVKSPYSHEQAKKILREIELKKSRAIALVRRFQNC